MGYLMMKVMLMAVVVGVIDAEAGRHHVVGEDRGWDRSSDLQSWSQNRIFMPGDSLWFAYSAAEESIVELKSQEEFESCNVNNPIRMYADGLNEVKLGGVGSRFFTSANTGSCRSGLKLHVQVVPTTTFQETVKAIGPSPSGSVRLSTAPRGLAVGAMVLAWVFTSFMV
ncbi:hypothetical protein AMTRI_Chr10g229160 [Amborella trichopoda]|uniref:Phytocyanin domain-containing protein n=1 Tax=Amborella trichopoda TaxID=13333 RepID=W1P3V8_AMBTC|nr:mavicyanin [Amborella trichopoda]ERN01640.1 hypothetical protein AMTR_s00090p00096100 [Amborella trichopoda]|eukprot:XP_006839071.1 mavicyanin [Amborella trichopoda]